jgi:PAS domain S-box-containing protein
LVAADPTQLEIVARARENIALWETKYADPQIAMRDAGRDISAFPGRQKSALMLDAIRLGLANLSRRQADIWEMADARNQWQRDWQTMGFGILSLLAIGIVVASAAYAYHAFQRHVRKDRRRRDSTAPDRRQYLDALLTSDEEGFVLVANPAAEKLFGADAWTLVGRRISELFPQRAFSEPLERLGRGTFETEARALFPPHETHPVEISISDVIVDGRRQFVTLVRDITERRRNEEALRQIGLGVSAGNGQ